MAVIARASFQLEGGKELFAKLQELADDGEAKAAKKIVRKAVRAGAKPVLQRMRELAPMLATAVANRVAGLLRKFIKIRGGRSRRGEIAIKVGTGKGNNDAFYAHMVNSGTKQRQTKSGANRGQVDPQHFAERALQERAGQAIQIITDEIRAGLEQFWAAK